MVHAKFAVVRDRQTGKIKMLTDNRGMSENRFETLLDWTRYYPYNFTSPFEAYIVPPDTQVGEKVWIEDLIEDFVGRWWNQSDTFRFEGCEAICNGSGSEFNMTTERM